MRYKYVYEVQLQAIDAQVESDLIISDEWRYGIRLFQKYDENNVLCWEPVGGVPEDSHVEYDVKRLVAIVYTNTPIKEATQIGRNDSIKKLRMPNISLDNSKDYEIGRGCL